VRLEIYTEEGKTDVQYRAKAGDSAFLNSALKSSIPRKRGLPDTKRWASEATWIYEVAGRVLCRLARTMTMRTSESGSAAV
jgi:hypothetical protein